MGLFTDPLFGGYDRGYGGLGLPSRLLQIKYKEIPDRVLEDLDSSLLHKLVSRWNSCANFGQLPYCPKYLPMGSWRSQVKNRGWVLTWRNHLHANHGIIKKGLLVLIWAM